MKKFRNIFLILFVLVFFDLKAFCATAWVNNLRASFSSNRAIIYAINIRTFNAKDSNQNGIIEENLGEEKGTFLNAIDRLDELAACGVNTIQLLPVTPVGKVKALGTAGSLYAASSFNEINPQLKSPKSKLSVNDEMRKFVDECHKRNMSVIVDLPCCGSYDLYLKNPDLFKKDKSQNPIIPADWTDVRLFDAGTGEKINADVYNLYQSFLDLMVDLDVDGVRADMASMKPYSFWKKLIDGTRETNPQFLFLAEASPSWKKAPSEYVVLTPCDRLLDAGFDGYYGNYSDLKNWKTSHEFFSNVMPDVETAKKYSANKSVLGNFATHDQVSPILINGPQLSKMIIWLNSTLPLNAYYIDGFPMGDNYIYPWANKKAAKTFTDDEYYFVHRGQLDIFNFSRKPQGAHYDVFQDFFIANKFRNLAQNVLSNGNFVTLRTSLPGVFAYARSFNGASVIVIGNLDFKRTLNVKVSVPKINSELPSVPIKISSNIPKVSKGKIETQLAPGEIQVLFFSSLDLK
ncbi:MAG: hypothetical protein WCY19_06850 [Candidatus Gastranaerophilaceae bacterium]